MPRERGIGTEGGMQDKFIIEPMVVTLGGFTRTSVCPCVGEAQKIWVTVQQRGRSVRRARGKQHRCSCYCLLTMLADSIKRSLCALQLV